MAVSKLLTVDHWLSPDGPRWGQVLRGDRDGIRHYVLHGTIPSSFLAAILQDRLKEAYLHADYFQRRNINDYIEFLMTEVPAVSYGSPEAYNDWISIGGAIGLRMLAAEMEIK
jgi:hypothetical protein